MNKSYETTAIFQWNANGLRSKSGDFRHFIAQYQFPILALSEARVNDDFRKLCNIQITAFKWT